MPTLKRTRSKVHETDSESSDAPTIGNQSTKRTKGGASATHHKLRSSSEKLAVYIVAVKLGPGRTLDGLSKLVEDSSDYVLAKNGDEADVLVTGIGMRKRLERSVSAELIVSCRCLVHMFWKCNVGRYLRTGNPSSHQLGWKSRSQKENDSRITNIKLSISGEAKPPTTWKALVTIATTRLMERNPLPALRAISVLLPSSPVSASRLWSARTRSSSSSSTSLNVPGSLMRTGGAP